MMSVEYPHLGDKCSSATLRWRRGQKTLCFTGVLWAIFAYLAVVRSSVTRQYEVQEALVNYVESIISHPGVSGVRLRTPGETGMCLGWYKISEKMFNI